MLIGLLSVLAIVSCKEKERSSEATTNQTIEVKRSSCGRRKPDGTSISVGTDGVDVSTKMEQAQLGVNVSGGKAKGKLKNNPVFFLNNIVKPT
jgi:hypothetical protein